MGRPWRRCRAINNAVSAGSAALTVKGVCLSGAGEVLLCRNWRDEWELPGGRPEPGERFEDCLAREFSEETGLEIGILDAVDASGSVEVEPGRWVHIVAFGCVVQDGSVPVCSDEHQMVRFVAVDQLGDLRLPQAYREAIDASIAHKTTGMRRLPTSSRSSVSRSSWPTSLTIWRWRASAPLTLRSLPSPTEARSPTPTSKSSVPSARAPRQRSTRPRSRGRGAGLTRQLRLVLVSRSDRRDGPIHSRRSAVVYAHRSCPMLGGDGRGCERASAGRALVDGAGSESVPRRRALGGLHHRNAGRGDSKRRLVGDAASRYRGSAAVEDRPQSRPRAAPDGHSYLAVAGGEGDVAAGAGGGPWDYATVKLIVEEAGDGSPISMDETRLSAGTPWSATAWSTRRPS